MSITKQKAVSIIEHCISQFLMDDSGKDAQMWISRAYERIIFSWQLGMLDEDEKEQFLLRIGKAAA